MAASVFHLELRQFPHTARAYNLSREEVHARFIGPWLRGQVVELNDQRFAPERASLKIYEGRQLRTEELGYGRGWANATRTGEEVTDRELAAARPEAARGAGAAPDGHTGLKGELVALCEVGTVSLPQTLALATGAMPTARVSQRLANAELAVWELCTRAGSGSWDPAARRSTERSGSPSCWPQRRGLARRRRCCSRQLPDSCGLIPPVRSVTRVGIAVSVAGMVVSAFGLYEVLHIETCLSGNIEAHATGCTKDVSTHLAFLTFGLLAAAVGLFLAWHAFWWLFPTLFIVEGVGALIAGLTSKGVTSSDVSGKLGKELGWSFIAGGLVALVVLGLVWRLIGWGNRKARAWKSGLAARTSATYQPVSPVAPVAPVAPGAPAAASAGVLDRIERLAALRDQGALTDSEFAAQKAKLLGDL